MGRQRFSNWRAWFRPDGNRPPYEGFYVRVRGQGQAVQVVSPLQHGDDAAIAVCVARSSSILVTSAKSQSVSMDRPSGSSIRASKPAEISISPRRIRPPRELADHGTRSQFPRRLNRREGEIDREPSGIPRSGLAGRSGIPGYQGDW